MFSQTWEEKQGYLFLPFLFHIVLEILACAIRLEKQRKYIQTRREEIKLFLFLSDIIVCMENSQEFTRKKNFLELRSKISKVAGPEISKN